MSYVVSLELDNEKLIGILTEANSGSEYCVISCHGLLASKDSPKYSFLSERLAKENISSFRFDFRGCGESGGNLMDSHISKRRTDLDAVIKYVSQDFGKSKIGLFGSSMGGFISILQASHDSKIKALVTLSSPFSMADLFFANSLNTNYFEIDGFGFGRGFLKDIKMNGALTDGILEKIQCPTYVFHGDADLLVPLEHAKMIYNGLRSTDNKKLDIIHGGDHIFSHPYHLAEILNKSVSWFVNNLKEV